MENLHELYLDKECAEYLTISIFIRTIQAKISLIEPKDENIIVFEQKWAEFLKENLENVQFLQHKLYFVHYEVEKLLTK